jgi:hypothetical protein
LEEKEISTETEELKMTAKYAAMAQSEVSQLSSEERSKGETLNTAWTDQRIVSIGKTTAPTSLDEWKDATLDQPMPMYYTLTSICDHSAIVDAKKSVRCKQLLESGAYCRYLNSKLKQQDPERLDMHCDEEDEPQRPDCVWDSDCPKSNERCYQQSGWPEGKCYPPSTIVPAAKSGYYTECPQGWAVRSFCASGGDSSYCKHDGNKVYSYVVCDTPVTITGNSTYYYQAVRDEDGVSCKKSNEVVVGTCFSSRSLDCIKPDGTKVHSYIKCTSVAERPANSETSYRCTTETSKEKDFIVRPCDTEVSHGKSAVTMVCNGRKGDCRCNDVIQGKWRNNHNAAKCFEL